MNNPSPYPVLQNCCEAEWELRVQIAACYRAFVHYGWTDSIFTHLSTRVPDHPQHCLINPNGLPFHGICASNLVEVDLAWKAIMRLLDQKDSSYRN